MANEPTTTLTGNLTSDPELRFTQSGAAVANFTVACTPRTFDRDSGEWKDGETLFMRCSVWRDAAEHVAESLTRGTRVIVSGRLRSRSYERDGQNRTVVELDVDEVGPSLRYATAKVSKVERGQTGWGQQPQGQGQPQQGWGQQPQGGQGWGQQPQKDPWQTPQQQPAPQAPQHEWVAGQNRGGQGYDQPPF